MAIVQTERSPHVCHMSSQSPSHKTTSLRKPSKMAFGSSVETLLEVYSNCISLLKAFKGRGSDQNGPASSRRYEQDRNKQVQLRKSLKSDQARVRRAYSSAMSEAGSRFEKGDDRARSALSRVLSKLKAAITNILRSAAGGRDQKQTLDYESLMLLSNASRSETIREFDRLSRRLGRSESRLTVRTSASSSSSSSSSGHKKRRRSSGDSESGSMRRDGKRGANNNDGSSRRKAGAAGPSQQPRKDGKGDSSSARDAVGREKTKLKKTASTPSPQSQSRRAPAAAAAKHHISQDTVPPLRTPTPTRRRSPTQPAAAVPNRMSIASIATDSTKLGEIPERKWASSSSSRHQRHRPRNSDSTTGDDDDDEYYNVSPVFPLKRYESPVRERRFLGLFRRRS